MMVVAATECSKRTSIAVRLVRNEHPRHLHFRTEQVSGMESLNSNDLKIILERDA